MNKNNFISVIFLVFFIHSTGFSQTLNRANIISPESGEAYLNSLTTDSALDSPESIELITNLLKLFTSLKTKLPFSLVTDPEMNGQIKNKYQSGIEELEATLKALESGNNSGAVVLLELAQTHFSEIYPLFPFALMTDKVLRDNVIKSYSVGLDAIKTFISLLKSGGDQPVVCKGSSSGYDKGGDQYFINRAHVACEEFCLKEGYYGKPRYKTSKCSSFKDDCGYYGYHRPCYFYACTVYDICVR